MTTVSELERPSRLRATAICSYPICTHADSLPKGKTCDIIQNLTIPGAVFQENAGSLNSPAEMYPGYSLLLRQAPRGSPCPAQPENIPSSPAPSPCRSTPAYCQLQTGSVSSKTTVALAPARLLIMRRADTVSQQTAFTYCGEKQNEGKRKNGLIRENQLEGKTRCAVQTLP